MGLKDYFDKMREKRSQFKEMQTQRALERKLNERELSSDERELNKIVEKQRQEGIKARLSKIRDHQDKNFWHSKTALDTPNVMTGHQSILSGQKLFSVSDIKRREAALFFR